jgi:hypothetical protein
VTYIVVIVLLVSSNIVFIGIAGYFGYRYVTIAAYVSGYDSGHRAGIEHGVLLARASLRVQMDEAEVTRKGILRRTTTIKQQARVGFGDTVVFQNGKLRELDAQQLRDLLKSILAVAGAAAGGGAVDALKTVANAGARLLRRPDKADCDQG